jgi:MFS family permease
MKDGRWLAHLCASRMSFGFIFMAYGAAMPLLMVEWRMTANQAGLVMSGWHLGYLVSLVVAGHLTGRWGAKRTLLTMSWAASASAWVFALFADSFTSALLLYTLAGLCSGGSYTPGLALIAERIASGRRATAMGWFLAASSMGYLHVGLWLARRLRRGRHRTDAGFDTGLSAAGTDAQPYLPQANRFGLAVLADGDT